MTKTCTKCGRGLPATTEFFYAGPHYAGGLRSECKDCYRARATRPEAIARRREWYAENRERRCLASRQWAAAHRDEKGEYNRRYRLSHAKEQREYREGRAEHIRETFRRYRLAHLDEFRAAQHKARAKRRRASGSHTAADVRTQYDRQRGRCYWCRESVGDAYHVDHVIPLARGGGNGPENLVIACPSCNLKKHSKLPYEFSDRLC